MNNGRITIELAGVNTPLTFGMQAVEEFGKRQSIGGNGWAKLICDLVFAGYQNEEVLCERHPTLTYREIAERLDDLIISKSEVLTNVFKCFQDSKAGAELFGVVKKKEENQVPKQAVKRTKKPTGIKLNALPSVS